jgi:FkbM family methyltransferase
MTISNTKLPLFLSRWLYYVSSIFTILLGLSPKVKIIQTFLGLHREPFLIILNDGLQFKVRSAMDIWVIKESCLDLDYEHYGTTLQAGWTIVDIGGGLGDFTLIAACIPNSEVHVYEPFPESHALLQENLQQNHIQNVHVYAEAVSAKQGRLQLATATGAAVRHSTAQDDENADLTVKTVPLTSVIQRLKSGHIDFLKIDCEGGEYDILLHADDSLLNAITHICLEYHDNLTPHTHHELVQFLSEKGFDVKTYNNPAHTEIGFLYARKGS